MSETLRTRHGYIGYNAADQYDLESFEQQKIGCAILIEEMKVKPDIRSKGYGAKLLNKFIAMHAMSYVVLQAYPFEETQKTFQQGQDRLLKYYSRFGFIHVGGGWMYRTPTILLDHSCQTVV